MAKSTKMSVFTLSMMTVAAVVSLRGLPMMAKEGLSMIFYILFATVMFLIPASLVAAELGGAFSAKGGGVYTWIKEAFGSRWGFTAIMAAMDSKCCLVSYSTCFCCQCPSVPVYGPFFG